MSQNSSRSDVQIQHRSLLLLVLSIALLLLGSALALSLLNLPLPNTDPVVGHWRRVVVFGFAAMCLGIGSGSFISSIIRRVGAAWWIGMLLGVGGMLLAFGSVIFHYHSLLASH